MLKTVRVLLHLEATDDGGVAWWAESDDVPGFTAAAPELVELRRRVRAALADEFPAGVDYSEELVTTDPVAASSTAQPRLTVMSEQTGARSVALRMKQLVA